MECGYINMDYRVNERETILLEFKLWDMIEQNDGDAQNNLNGKWNTYKVKTSSEIVLEII